jgi:hypothetical protein
MLEFQNHNIPGELWLRSPNGDKQLASMLLNNIYAKYETLNPSVTSNLYGVVYGNDQAIYDTFYGELTSNQITRFDSFYDSIFIETKSGCIFEKIYTEDNLIKPFTVSDNFTAKHNVHPGFLSYDSYVDYWFDESNNRVFYVYLSNLKENKDFPDRFAFAVIVNIFDCNTGLIRTVMLWKVVLNLIAKDGWDPFNFIIEPPKLTFNSTTRTFNVSFLLKNENKQFGLISVNFKQSDTLQNGLYEIKEVNGHLPFFTIDPSRCEAYPFDPHGLSLYRVVTVASNKNDPAYNLKFVLLDYWNEYDEIFEAKYLDIE